MQTRSVDDVFHALADRERRLVVRYLMHDDEGVAAHGEVADHLASHGAACAEQARIRLEHTILPMLAEAGLLRYDGERERIRYRSDEFAESVLTVVDGE